MKTLMFAATIGMALISLVLSTLTIAGRAGVEALLVQPPPEVIVFAFVVLAIVAAFFAPALVARAARAARSRAGSGRSWPLDFSLDERRPLTPS